MRIHEDVNRFIEYAYAHPDGFTRDEIKSELGWGRSRFNKIINRARFTLGETSAVNLVCDPQGAGEQWLYRLAGTGVLMAPWQVNSTKHELTRLATHRNTWRSLARGHDGRTIDGRAARYADKILTRLIEDMEEMLVL